MKEKEVTLQICALVRRAEYENVFVIHGKTPSLYSINSIIVF